MNIFLTGINGYLGSVLADALAKESAVESITGIDIVSPSRPFPPKVKYVQMDIRSPEVTALMAGHEVVVHTAFVVFWKHKMPKAVLDDINLNGVRNVAQAALDNQVGRFIHTSSSAAYDPDIAQGKSDLTEEMPTGKGNSFFYYANGKAAAERTITQILGKAGISLTFLRPPYVIGPCNRDTVEGFRTSAVKFPGVDPRLQFIHEDDVASAFLQAVRTDLPGAYNVAPDDCMHLSEVFQMIGLPSVRTVPLWLARWITGIRWRYFGQLIHPSWVEAQVANYTLSNARLKATGWRPRYLSAAALRTAL